MPIPSTQQFTALLALIDARLPERVEALEAKLAKEGQQPEPLRERNASRQADGQRLQEAIADILAQHPGPGRLPAKRVWQVLADTDVGRAERPSLRTVQHHITQIRKAAVLRESRA